VPKACLRREKTTTILVNEVNIIRMEGAIANIVSRRRSLRTVETWPDSPEPPIFKLIVGMGRGSDHADVTIKKKRLATTRKETTYLVRFLWPRLFIFS
jgi:hypothetical protein